MDGVRTFATQATFGDYRALFEQSPIPLALVSLQGEPRFVTASRGFLATFDLARSAVEACALDKVLIAHGHEDLLTAVRRSLAAPEDVLIKVEVRGADSRRFIRLRARAASGFDNHVVLEAEGSGYAVHSDAQWLASLFNQAGGEGPTMTYVNDLRSRRIRYADCDLVRRLAFPAGGMLFKEFATRVHPDDLADHGDYEISRDALGDDQFATRTVRVRDRDAEWRLISLRSRVLRRSRDGAVRLVLGTATDVTDYAAAAVEAEAVLVARAEANERARIGQELHDSTSQHLVAADLGLSRVLRGGGLSVDEQERLRGVHDSLAMAQTEMRAFAFFLHPPELRELGLFKAVERFCMGFARRSELEIAFKAGPSPVAISFETEHALFRVCQEALMNVHRHAYARRVSVRLQVTHGQLVLEVRDDGVGVDGIDRFEHGGMGVAGMRSRMNSVGGELVLDYLGPGLSVTARAPQPSIAAAAGAAAEPSRRRARGPSAVQPEADERHADAGHTSIPTPPQIAPHPERRTFRRGAAGGPAAARPAS